MQHFDCSSRHRYVIVCMEYPVPGGVFKVPIDDLDLRHDEALDDDLLNAPMPSSEKNIWFFWDRGFPNMYPYAKRTVRAWHRRFSKAGWTIRVVDMVPGSPLNIARLIDLDLSNFPQAFLDGTITGTYAAQHTSDLVRWPLLLRYGGVYADVGLMQIGDLDRLWHETVANPKSPFQVISYEAGSPTARDLTNYFLACGKNNPLFQRCHRLLLALWAEDGGKTSTDGMHASPLLEGLPMLGAGDSLTFTENGRTYGPEETSKMLTDYIVQGQAMRMVMGTVDEANDWNGPKYVAEHVFAIDYMQGSQLINEMTAWDGSLAFELMSLSLPAQGARETEKQQRAREIVQACLRKSFGFKLAHGLILRVLGPTLGSLWRQNPDSDDVAGTYAHWLRYGIVHWCPDALPVPVTFGAAPPHKVGSLLRA